MRALLCLAAMLALLPVASARAQNAGVAYAVDYDRLYRVDLDSREATLIGAAGQNGPQLIGDLSGLTTTPDGTLYAASDTIKSLVRLDPDTGAATVVGPFAVSGGDPTAPLDFGMTAACDGGLWLTSATSGQLWRVDPASAETTLVGPTGYDITGLVVLGEDLFGAGGRGDEGLYRIDTDSGAASRVGDGFGRQVTYAASVSPAFTASGKLLAAVNYIPPAMGDPTPADWSDLVMIDPATGIADVLGPITGPDSLVGIGIRGFTLGPPQCAPLVGTGRPPTAIPASGTVSLWLQLSALAIVAVVALRRRRVARR